VHNSSSPGLGTLGSVVVLTAQPGGLTAGSDAFNAIAATGKTIAMHVAAAKPKYAVVSEVPGVCVMRALGVLKQFGFGCCDNSVREKDWRCHKRGTLATRACLGDLAGVTRAQPFSRVCTHCFGGLVESAPVRMRVSL
jgi:hypothetical protein